jgi:hypothetical protein
MSTVLVFVGVGLAMALGVVHAVLWWRSGRAVADYVFGWLGSVVGFGLLVCSLFIMETDTPQVLWIAVIFVIASGGALETARLRRRIKELKAELEAARSMQSTRGSNPIPESR